MSVLNNSSLAVDIKTADRLREWFSKRGTGDGLKLTQVALGDSDVDYRMESQHSIMRVLNAPFQPPQMKYKLLYNGSGMKLTGKVTAYTRHVLDTGIIQSLYSYPPNNSLYTSGVVPPTITQGYDQSNILFDEANLQTEGYIVYFQTIPDNYYDDLGNPLRVDESYTITIGGLFPNVAGVWGDAWEIIIDSTHRSMLICKPFNYVFQSQNVDILIKGDLTGIEKYITFNI